jgi:phage-related protein
VLYFFHGQTAVVVSHGFKKQEATVPPIEIEHARRRKAQYEADPAAHAYAERLWLDDRG